MNRWNINKVEGKPARFGTGAHITLPKDWLDLNIDGELQEVTRIRKL